MSEIKTYKDLLIWQKGIEIVKEVYFLCKEIPNDEVFGLQSQIKRSSISIPSNIAEGWGRNYTKNYLQFLIFKRVIIRIGNSNYNSKRIKFYFNRKF